MTTSKKGKDLRRYPRMRVPVQLRPESVFGPKSRVQDISLGGLRIAGQKRIKRGKIYRIKFALADGSWAAAKIRLVWIVELPSEQTLKYDIGCEFTDLPVDTEKGLKELLTRGA
jgi:hypothetical protein